MLRAVITDFLAARYKDKLEAVKEDVNDPDAANQQREKLRQQFIPATWLEDAARRAAQIQAVTHSLKPVHPDAKGTYTSKESTPRHRQARRSLE
ncbi:type I-F CRISPR-associated protein Csy1 [Rhodoferax sp.]|uniref:type I-F CRISPR-associated protein Csy1 n=1 Tax=Rhodoferax sp. TaxID=50421 RepID=UPI0025D3EAB0|nr:type I-F CRISPR-associated protein Csy1 [Rhodoferax sp.]MCM2340924.1 type I-F CRISPR-associated protein Csy1 [Rhodoferax sp.]